jgi:hypothetical protein
MVCIFRPSPLLYSFRKHTSYMSSALAKAAPLKPEIRLAQAISQFDASLSDEQKATLRADRVGLSKSPPDIRDVMRLTAEIDRRAAAKMAGGRCFGPRLTNILQAIQQFAALGDVVVGASQNVAACGVWSLVRMTLLVSCRCLPSLCAVPANAFRSQSSICLPTWRSYRPS